MCHWFIVHHLAAQQLWALSQKHLSFSHLHTEPSHPWLIHGQHPSFRLHVSPQVQDGPHKQFSTMKCGKFKWHKLHDNTHHSHIYWRNRLLYSGRNTEFCHIYNSFHHIQHTCMYSIHLLLYTDRHTGSCHRNCSLHSHTCSSQSQPSLIRYSTSLRTHCISLPNQIKFFHPSLL